MLLRQQQVRTTTQQADFGQATAGAKVGGYYEQLSALKAKAGQEATAASDVHTEQVYEQQQRTIPYEDRDVYLAEEAKQQTMLERQKTIEAQKSAARESLEETKQTGRESLLNIEQDFESVMSDVGQGHKIDLQTLKANQTLTRDEKQQIYQTQRDVEERTFKEMMLDKKQGFEEKMVGIKNDNTLSVIEKKAGLELARDEIQNSFDVTKYEFQAAQQSYRQNMGSIYDAQLFDLKNRAKVLAAETEQDFTIAEIRENEQVDQRMEARREEFKAQILQQKLDAEKELNEYRLKKKEDEWRAKLKDDKKTVLKAADHNSARVQLDTLFNKLKGEFGTWTNVNVKPGYNTAIEIMGKIKEGIVKNSESFDPQIVASESFNETLRAYTKADLILNSQPLEGESESDRLIRITNDPELVRKARGDKLAVLNTMIAISGLTPINFKEPKKTIRAMLTLD